jgi:AraC-like DNA-binding protein
MVDGKSGILDFFRSSEVNYLSLNKEDKQQLIADFFNLRAAADTDSLTATATLLRILSKVKNNMHVSVRPEKSDIPAEMQAIIDYINTNYSAIPSIHVLPEQFFISPSTIHRWFDRYLHVSPKAYLESVKLSNAKRVLERGESVTDACLAAGYSDCSHFISVFRRKFGETPLQYKKAVQDASSPDP